MKKIAAYFWKLVAYFRTFTAARWVKLFSLLLVLANTVLLIGATVATIPGVPPAVAYCWPFGYAAALAIHQLASVFGVKPDPDFDAKVRTAVAEALQLAQVVQTAESTFKQAEAVTSIPGAPITSAVLTSGN